MLMYQIPTVDVIIVYCEYGLMKLKSKNKNPQYMKNFYKLNNKKTNNPI